MDPAEKFKPSSRFWLLMLIFFGFLLRFYNLGKSSFWLDEVGVANIIQMPNLLQVLDKIKDHAMAMPLDYISGWLAARICTTDACLRFPSVVWGTLSIPLLYFLVKTLSNEKVALTASLFLTLSTLHIYYAQELRYYEALLFFTILVWLALLRALQVPSLKRWALFILIAVLGEYTHIYVVLSLSFGFFLLVLSDKNDPQLKKKWIHFIASAFIVGLILLPGYLIYSETIQYPEPFDLGRAFVSVLMGTGWFPFQNAAVGLIILWGGVYLIFGIYGNILVVRSHDRQWIAWILSGVLNSALILIADAKWSYWIVPRQFLQLLPIGCGLWALGVLDVWNNVFATIAHSRSRQKVAVTILVGVLILGNIPNLQAYYQNRKGLSREISAALQQHWQAGSSVLVVPLEYPVTYNYYLKKDYRQDIISVSNTFEVTDPKSLRDVAVNTFLITPKDFTMKNTDLLSELGFQRIHVEGEGGETNLPYLWVKK